MIKYLDRSYVAYIGLMAGVVSFILCFVMLGNTPAKAQSPGVCRAAIVLDRSESVDPSDLETMRQQITRLFQPGGVNNAAVQLAFWSFSSTSNPSVNYDAPFNGFVSSRGVNSAFQTSLYQIVSGGRTNYEQGFGYDGFVSGNQTMNTSDGINNVIDQAGVIVFMTDGVPNLPSSNGGIGVDNNVTARNAARAAVLKHKAAGKVIVGGIVGNISQNSLNYVINGNDNDATNTFRITDNYSDVTTQLTTIINDKCNAGQASNYNLTPKAYSPNTVVFGTDGATITYNVNNSAATGVSDPTGWTIKQLLIDRGQSVDPLMFGNPGRCGYNAGNPSQSKEYCDNMNDATNSGCRQLLALVNNNGTCSQIGSGQRVFNTTPPDTSLDADAPVSATSVVVDDSWPIGSKVCFVLTLDKPTESATPTNRYSRAACIVVGKSPQVQIHGGDLKVGRYFINDTTPLPTDPNNYAKVMGSKTNKQNGLTYGSWAEYGVYAPGVVSGFASLSGFEGGLDTTLAGAQQNWSKLTFANTNDDNSFGYFAHSGSYGMGAIPNAKTAILAGRTVNHNLNAGATIDLNGASSGGLYQMNTGNLTINTSVIEGGNTVIVHVPQGTVTIAGNIDYSNGPYSNINQIPQLVIIAKGITINASVTHVSAWMIADSADDGRITTCDYAANLTIADCNQELRIDGPIMAQHLRLRRTAGAGTVANNQAGLPAEIINLPAGAYLWAQSAGSNNGRALTTFTTELPPYF